MAKLVGVSPDRMAEHFVNYLYDQYKGSRHVRRVASWIGFVIMGVEALGVSSAWKVPRKRQFKFEYHETAYIVKYDHAIGGHGGGIVIYTILPGTGCPLGQRIHTITSLSEAEYFYKNVRSIFP